MFYLMMCNRCVI